MKVKILDRDLATRFDDAMFVFTNVSTDTF